MTSSRTDGIRWAVVTVAASLVLFVACGDSAKPVAAPVKTTATTRVEVTTTTAPRDFVATEATFVNLKKMTPVRFFFVANGLGDLEATLKVANSKDGGVYPVGTIIQLVPQEAMVKRAPGFNPAGNDWEFFFLDVSTAGTKIVTRGKNEVKNRFGGQCSSCHQLAAPKWDLICEQDHGCADLPIGRDLIKAIQDLDNRPL
jgi:hypothetical protein